MPEGALYVGRGTPWGNPFTIEFGMQTHPAAGKRVVSEAEAREFVVDLYRLWVTGSLSRWTDRRPLPISDLTGIDLTCWCRLDQRCHADVLLELSNADPG